MNKRFISVLVFALLVSAAASFLVYRLTASRVRSEPKQVVSQVIVAARNLPVGTLIRDPDVKPADWAGPVPQHSLLKREDAVGRGVIANIYEGETILGTRLAPKGAGAGLAATIPPGMRAVAVRVNEVVGVAGFVVPGMRVDVLISGSPPGVANTQGTLSRTVLQNIEVLSAGQNIQKDAEGKPVTVPVVNLLVTPEQAEVLSLASNETRIQLVLRNPLDTQITKTTGTAIANLFSGLPYRSSAPQAPPTRRVSAPRAKASPPAAKPAPEPPLVVEVIHGTSRVQAKFGESKEAKP
ncbi:MAG: Flp pilus assembly protein CpaB [Acidobacteriota bacterium]